MQGRRIGGPKRNISTNAANVAFAFLGYTFMPRKAKGQNGKEFTSFLPAISQQAQKRIRQEIRKWPLLKLHHITIGEIANQYNPVIRGWLNYYGKYGRAVLRQVLEHINKHLLKWVQRKYRRFKQKPKQAAEFLGIVAQQNRELFAHWNIGVMPMAG